MVRIGGDQARNIIGQIGVVACQGVGICRWGVICEPALTVPHPAFTTERAQVGRRTTTTRSELRPEQARVADKLAGQIGWCKDAYNLPVGSGQSRPDNKG